jgi:hypothetical protein
VEEPKKEAVKPPVKEDRPPMAGDDVSGYDDESSGDEVTRIEEQIRKGQAQYKPVKKDKPSKDEDLVLTQNAYAGVRKEMTKQDTSKGMKIKAVLQKKKTVKDNKGDEWEVTEQREKVLIQKPVVTDSEDGSELSFD